jgi:catechol 2,3-dioxygenase-like lactoylglutathione lyase family enzyme
MPDEMQITLEVVVVPVSDVDRSKEFYEGQLGFRVDHDTTVSDEMRIVQLTPPGSGCSIVIAKGIPQMDPGALAGVQLVVADLDALRSRFLARGVDVSEVEIRGPAEMDGSRFVSFPDPDGNLWAVQELRARAEA